MCTAIYCSSDCRTIPTIIVEEERDLRSLRVLEGTLNWRLNKERRRCGRSDKRPCKFLRIYIAGLCDGCRVFLALVLRLDLQDRVVIPVLLMEM